MEGERFLRQRRLRLQRHHHEMQAMRVLDVVNGKDGKPIVLFRALFGQL